MNTGKAPSLCGFLNVLKPPGMTSAQVVGFARRLFGGVKVGHGGTLDPEAAGVLPLMVGKAARLFDYMQDKEKAYVAEVAFGCSTDTQDAQGVPLEWTNGCPSEAEIREALPRFTGEIWQRPPMYSAIKQEGRRLYELARAGKTADIPMRQATVHELSLVRLTEPRGALLRVRCAKGFYVRTLCHDLGQALGCPAHMRFLLRTQSGVFTLDSAHSLETLEEAAARDGLARLLLPPETAVGHLPQARVPAPLRAAFLTGGRLPFESLPELRETEAAEGVPTGLWLEGRLMAVGVREGNAIRLRTWLGD